VNARGERADDDAYMLPPTVFEDVRDHAFLSCEEVFGPITSLYRFTGRAALEFYTEVVTVHVDP
jgi:acyl-CoA reductase-like NAD-dependent aldehyde dehydrogenase